MVERNEEREAKFGLPEGVDLPDLSGVDPALRAAPRPPLDLTARYFDTAGLRLLRRGITVRHRREAGGGDIDSRPGRWTLKLPERAGKAAFARTELSWPGAPGPVPPEPAGLVRAVALGGDLVPVAEIHTLRRRLALTDEGGSPLAEVDDDSVTISTAAGELVRFRQLEVELTGGDERLLSRVAARLEAGGARREPDEPKLARALLAESGDPGDRADPAGTGPSGGSGPDGGDPVAAPVASDAELAQQSIARGLEQILRQDIGLRLDDDPEFVHQARVATRRMRADLATFGSGLDAAWTGKTRDELKWLAAALGRVRDADVLGERLAEHAGRAGPDHAASFAQLEAALGRQREEAAADLQRALASPRYLALLQELDQAAAGSRPAAARLPGGPPEESADEVAYLVNRRWRRFRDRVARLGPAPSDEQLHALRIAAKKVRYAAEAAVPLAGDRARRFSRDVADLQAVLGDHHDSVVAEQWCREVEASGPAAAAPAARYCIEREREAQARERRLWEDEWSRVADRHPRAW